MYKNLNPAALGVSGHQSEIIELALTYGFRGMDVDIAEMSRRAKKHGLPYATRLIESARARTGFKTASFALPVTWDTDDDSFRVELEKLEEYADIAKEIDCSCSVAVVAPAGDKRPYHENFEFHRHRFSEIGKVLEPRGVRLGIGFQAAPIHRTERAFQFIHQLDALKLLVNMIGATNVGILLDTWQLYVAGGSADDIRDLKVDQIVCVRVADLPEGVPLEEVTDTNRLLVGATNRIDNAAMLAALAELGYYGPVTPEPARTTLDGTRRDPIVRAAADAMDRLWQAAGLVPENRKAPFAGQN